MGSGGIFDAHQMGRIRSYIFFAKVPLSVPPRISKSGDWKAEFQD